MSIELKVILHGLIALVPRVETDGVNNMTALLLDARNPPAMECRAEHKPMLRVLTSNAQCLDAGCRAGARDCICTDSLARKDISLQVEPSVVPQRQALRSTPPKSLPDNRVEAGDFSYVGNLSAEPFNLELNLNYLDTPPPRDLLARMIVPFGEIAACALVTREDAGIQNIHSMTFHPLGKRGDANQHSQAMAQMVITRLEIPSSEEVPAKVTLHLHDMDSGKTHSMALRDDGNGYFLELSNDVAPLPRDAPCDDGVARHFALFYEIAKDPDSLANRLVPHVRPTQWRSLEGMTPPLCEDPTFLPVDRPICAMASFHPDGN